MKACVIYNPSAGSAQLIQQFADALTGFRLLNSESAADLDALVARATDERYELITAAGGDGTVNRVAAALMRLQANRPILGILPLGTGNDLARTLAIPIDYPEQAIQTLKQARTRSIDVIRVRHGSDAPRWCVNVAAGGFTGQMNEVMTDDLKAAWGPLAYIRGAIKVLPNLTGYHTRVTYDNESIAHDLCALNIIVANGRTAGGGTPVAPTASPEDGLLDVVIVRNGSTTELAGVAARLLAAGDYRNSDLVSHRRARSVAVRSVPGMWFNVDGELIGNEPVSFSIATKALRVVVGPNYQPGS